MIFRISLGLLLLTPSLQAMEAVRGAEISWTTYEAEDMKTTGEKLGPRYEPNLVETEASQQQCVRLAKPGEFVEFTAAADANALVVRYSLPDAENGGGLDSTINLLQNGKLVKKIPLTSRYSWLYGRYPFTNQPGAGKPRNCFDEAQVKNLKIARGDVLRLQTDSTAVAPCIIDFADLEKIPLPLAAPSGSLCVTNARFGAAGNGVADDTEALRSCIQAARAEGKIVWVPPGDFKITGDIDLPSGLTIQGAGIWHTTFVGDAAQYGDAQKRVRFNGHGSNIHLADFAIEGKLNVRNDNEPNDGVTGSFGADSTISRLWVEHTKTGIWVNNSRNLLVSGCRFRDTIADGVNFCVGMRDSTVTNCSVRGNGDDGFAIWPATHAPQDYKPGGNLITHCTAQFPFLANGAAIYGGEGNRIENCKFTDIATGCGVLISSTFPTADAGRNIDNNFSGTTTVHGCELIRCGGYDHKWAWRAALQVCLDRRSISSLDLRDIEIKNSISDGISIVAPGSAHGEGALNDTHFDNVSVINSGQGAKENTDLWISEDAQGTLSINNSRITGIKNNAAKFVIVLAKQTL